MRGRRTRTFESLPVPWNTGSADCRILVVYRGSPRRQLRASLTYQPRSDHSSQQTSIRSETVPALTVTACEREIETLHEFFVRWYCGTVGRDEFERVERALGPEFERVSPDGDVHGRDAVLSGIRGAYCEHETFEIEIRNVEPVVVDEHALVRYEEWQTTPTGGNGRLSTALFVPVDGAPTSMDEADDDREPESAPEPMARWRYLHETWLDAPE